MYGKHGKELSLLSCGPTVKTRHLSETTKCIMNNYYANFDKLAFQQAVVELLAVIANSYDTVDKELSSIRQLISRKDKE